MMLVSWLLKGSLLAVAAVLFYQWLNMVFRMERSLNVFRIDIVDSAGHNFVMGDFGGLMLGIVVMTILFVFQSPLWMYPLMLLSVMVMLGRVISFIQKGVNPLGIVGMSLEALGLAILLLFATNLVLY